MFTNRLNSPWVAGFITLLVLFVAGAVSIALEKPMGAIAGRISLEEKGFNLSTYDVRGNKVYVLAVGPRGGNIIERGAWVNPDGTFKIAQLPVGEYNLWVRATGFSTTEQSGIFVDDAKTTQLKDAVHLAILEPSVNVGASSRVFTTREVPHFWTNAQGSDRVTVRIYRKDILQLMANAGENSSLEFSSDLSLYKPYGRQKAGPLFEQEKPIQTLERRLNRDNEDWARADFKLNKPLPAGEYVVTAEVRNLKGSRDWNIMWFSVSDLGLIIKQAPEKTVVRAIDLNTLQPVPDVNVQLFPKNSPNAAELGHMRTGRDGFASMSVPATQRNETYYNFLAVGSQGQNRAFGGIDLYNELKESYQTYFYTERPVYRLGQMVYYKGISRLKTTDGLKAPKPGLSLNVTIEDPDNTKLWEGRLATTAHGSFNGTWQIPADGKTGAYQLTINYPDGSTSYQNFEVAQYRKPEYQVEVLPLDKRVTAGQKARVRIRATYYFGAPVTNARIKYSVYAASDWSGRFRLMPRPAYYGYYDDWEDDDTSYYEDRSYAGDYISEGYAQTDDTGEALVEFDTRPLSLPQDEPYSDTEDKRYTVQAEVTDLSRMSVVGSGVASVTAGDFTLFVQPKNYVTRAGEPVKAEINAVDYEGQPVANRTVTVSLVRWNWDRVKGEYRGKTTEGTATITTDAEGRAAVTLPTAGKLFTDNYYLTAQTQDNAGHTIYDQSGIWISSEHYPYVLDGMAAQQEAFSIKLDKKVYQPGEVARAMITAPLTGREQADVIVAIEGSKLHEYRVVHMDATARMIEIPLKSDYEPNVYVTATLVAPKHQFYNQSEMIKVSPDEHFLNIRISTDKPRYKPGETATYTVQATDPNGKPAQNTELSLGVVDESIYAIRPDPARDIRKFFYNKRYNAVSTLSSFPEEYSGGPDKIEPRLRKDFRDMAAWFPTLITDAKGVAKATVKLPDNLTTWRATVRGINLQSDVGSAVAKVLATQDLIVRLALPRFFTQHDEGLLTAIVHNYTDREQKVALTLKASPQFETREALVQQLSVRPEQAARYSWPVRVTDSGDALVNIRAVGQTEGDAMELRLPIRPLAIEMTEAASGVLKADPASVAIPLKIPAGVSPQTANVVLSIAASSLGPVLNGFDALIDYPYGCTEQTMSRLIPSAIAWQLHRKLDVPLSLDAQKRFDDVALKGLARLKDYHNSDGGWGWWRFDQSNPYMTAYVMEGLHLLRESGRPVGEDELGYHWQQDGIALLKRASAELAGQLGEPKIASDRWLQIERQLDLAYMQYVLSHYGQKTDAKVGRYLLGRLNQLPPEALSLMTLAYHQLGETQAARSSYEALNALSETVDGMTSWDHTLRLRKKLGFKEADYTYRFTGVESTALGLRAAAAMEHPKDSETSASRLEAIERWLIFQRNANGWDNTKTTAQVLRAMMAKALSTGKPSDIDFKAVSNLWQESETFGASNWYEPERVTRTALSEIEGQAIRLEKLGRGALYYTSLLSYWLPLKPGEPVPQKSLPEGLKIRRAFYRIHAEPVGPEGTMRFKTSEIPGNEVRAGETVLMKVLVDSPLALPYVIVDSALPSGGEVVSNDPRESLVDEADASNTEMNGDWGSWWWAHQDLLDDRVVMFATSLPAGKSEFHALVRMELPGTFQMNPVKLEGMYSKAIRAYSSVDTLRVKE
jgi:uncharacterized protein YfaS (alpha-2-macroglobulin family)